MGPWMKQHGNTQPTLSAAMSSRLNWRTQRCYLVRNDHPERSSTVRKTGIASQTTEATYDAVCSAKSGPTWLHLIDVEERHGIDLVLMNASKCQPDTPPHQPRGGHGSHSRKVKQRYHWWSCLATGRFQALQYPTESPLSRPATT